MAASTLEATTYHCTGAKDLNDILADGLDMRLSKYGYFGRGIYSATTPIKANKYWPKERAYDERVILQLRTLVGHTKQFQRGHYDMELQREPRGYDSVSGNIDGHSEVIVYNNNRCLIEYVIYYVDKQPKTPRFQQNHQQGHQMLPQTQQQQATQLAPWVSLQLQTASFQQIMTNLLLQSQSPSISNPSLMAPWLQPTPISPSLSMPTSYNHPFQSPSFLPMNPHSSFITHSAIGNPVPAQPPTKRACMHRT
eukprot:m.4872 g.4872  ORF g.4872 m.4872 type:complete len:252 (-) comp4683_c0_seq2:439-1194(-)